MGGPLLMDKTLFWHLVSWGPPRPAFAEVVLGPETLARLVFHHGECKVQERWDGNGNSGSVSLGIVHPMNSSPHEVGFLVF